MMQIFITLGKMRINVDKIIMYKSINGDHNDGSELYLHDIEHSLSVKESTDEIDNMIIYEKERARRSWA